jgi:hypothetical protein
MPSHELRGAREDHADDALAEALDLVENIDEWLLPRARWTDVADLIAALSTAADVKDMASIRSATAELRLLSPLRVKMIGEEPVEPPPPPVRDRLNILLHRSQSEPGSKPAEDSRSRDD